ncbi:MAG: SDR family oxidoreductase [Anaerolineae bacterium]|nr:SDR family oxidoreductase [Anaerolineae bacterium]
MKFDFSNKIALITGASRGIGRVIAQMMAEAGARVVVHYRGNRPAAEQTLAGLAGGPHLLAQADLAEAEAVRQLVETVVAEMGRIDIVVNNAGIFDLHPITKVSFADWQSIWQRTIATNLFGPANLIFLAAQQMIKQGQGGRIVNVSSRGAFRGEPQAPAYGASKAGLNAMGQSLAQALAPHNIFVHTVAPGFVETDMAEHVLSGPGGDAIRNQSPLGRVAKPEEVARTVLFLAAEGTEFLTGCIVDVNGASYLRT